MIDQQFKRLSLLLAITVMAGACSKESGVDYCKNHYKFHADHLAVVADLTVRYSDEGNLEGRLSAPGSAFGKMSEADVHMLLGNAQNTFVLQTEQPCAVLVSNLNSSEERSTVDFAASCGAENKLAKIDVALFDKLIDLEEVVTSVTTAATGKRFAINRKCERPIFRLD